VTLARHGVNDEFFSGADEAYLADLHYRYEEQR
jgi:hypothetical protein